MKLATLPIFTAPKFQFCWIFDFQKGLNLELYNFWKSEMCKFCPKILYLKKKMGFSKLPKWVKIQIFAKSEASNLKLVNFWLSKMSQFWFCPFEICNYAIFRSSFNFWKKRDLQNCPNRSFWNILFRLWPLYFFSNKIHSSWKNVNWN